MKSCPTVIVALIGVKSKGGQFSDGLYLSGSCSLEEEALVGIITQWALKRGTHGGLEFAAPWLNCRCRPDMAVHA
jgi:hypothetical protein